MAYEGTSVDWSFQAGADLSSSQYMLVKLDSSGNAILSDTAGEPVIGVLQNKPASGQQATVRLRGISKVVANATLSTFGATVASAGNGKTKAASALVQATGAASNVIGRVLKTASGANVLATIVFDCLSGILPTSNA